eukprot:TRINITY_DN16249_c0_g1_i1.p1 TRINITY_DN16249_c0_g1~~TRINITY_DN16249_c0_g1_i1.p1  ORF type:complete len:650 (-),score=126.43 TRINITY_DN16249_c0_g1_i1:64-2013(-)
MSQVNGACDGDSSAGVEHSISFSCSSEVARRVAQIYGDERLADVVFVVRQGLDGPERRLVGHRNIIAAWSTPLDRMLCGNFQEGSEREVQIRDADPDAFEVMLKMMYCGTAEITVDNVLAILEVSVRFDVAPLVQFSVQFLQNHTSSDHACRMLEVGVQYGLVQIMDKCIELIVTDDHILQSGDFSRLSQGAVVELAKHNSWNLHEDEIYDTMMRWAAASASCESQKRRLLDPILEHLRYPYMSVEKLKLLSSSDVVPSQLIFDALFFKLHHSGPDDPAQLTGRHRPRTGSLLFSWVQTSKVTVSGTSHENARHTSANGFTGVRGDRRMQHGIYSWTIEIAETQSSWIFVGIAQADDPNNVAWRSTGRMLYCLDSRYFHQGSGQNHPCGDRKICTGDCIRVVLDCTKHTLAFGINSEKPLVLFRDLSPVAYVPAVDLRDCGDKVHILRNSPHGRSGQEAAPDGWLSGDGTDSQSADFARLPPHSTPVVHSVLGDQSSMHAASTSSGHPRRPTTIAADVLAGGYTQPTQAADSAAPHSPPHDPPAAARRATVTCGEHLSTGGSGSSGTRMSQPRQSQGSQGGIASATLSMVALGSGSSQSLPPPAASPQERSGYQQAIFAEDDGRGDSDGDESFPGDALPAAELSGSDRQ